MKENSQEVLDGKERELNSLKDSNVFNSPEDHGLDSVIKFSQKSKENGRKTLKPWWIAQGFKEKCMNERADFLACNCQALRMVYVSASNFVVGTTFSWYNFSIPVRYRYWKISFCSTSIRNNGSRKDVEVAKMHFMG